ncbi:MAG TPA: type II toxin-antitoxin system VapC family toxin [Verrucomicrobiota bacterium]|nr:type II toxin-antitoxin system VapC family toxin [Verrucomicrobiota bacterium]
MSAETYVDTGILAKSYVLESDSAAAIAILEAVGDPLVFSHVHALEIPNAIRLKRFRGEITAAEETAAVRAFRADVDAGRLARPDYDLPAVFIRAEGLSAKHSGGIGSRSLDLLHVAAALEAGCTTFASFDDRQRKLAALAGLKLIPAKRGAKS